MLPKGRFYRRNSQEHKAITEAAATSIARVRYDCGGLLLFLADGFVQGGSYAYQNSDMLMELLEEVGELGNWATLKMFQRLTGVDPVEATAESAWQAILRWFPEAHSDIVENSYPLNSRC